MSWGAVRESEKRLIEQGRVSAVANLRLFLMAKSFAVRIEAEASSFLDSGSKAKKGNIVSIQECMCP